MDWNGLRDQVTNLSLYDVKASIRKVQNAVMNYTEMEAKVREATNNEPWGASSTLMQDISNATFNYQHLNEIMPMIYKRFTEKAAEEWRQIYKALQLMEFLIKNGSERVIDDARSHLSLLKMLRQFHFIDQNGKDQGLNVRNRSKELCDLLGDVEKIRAERKKARTTRNKYQGQEGGATLGMGSGGSGSRYGGFGSESAGGGSYGDATRGVYGDGGGFGGEPHGEYDEGEDTSGADKFEEYDEYDDAGAVASTGRRRTDPSAATTRTPKKTEAAKPKEPEVDLFDFGDEPAPSNGTSAAAIFAPPSSSSNSAATPATGADEDDFDDFQSAAPATATTLPKPNYTSLPPRATASYTQFAQPSPQPGASNSGFNSILSTTSSPPSSTTTPQPFKPSGYQPTGPNYFQPVQTVPSPAQSFGSTGLPGSSQASTKATTAKKPASGTDSFAGLLSGTGIKKAGASAQQGMTIADMAKQKSQAGLYGANATAQPKGLGAPSAPRAGTGSALDDLLG